MKPSATALSAEVLALASSGQTMAAIKLAREQSGLSLKDAKQSVDEHLRRSSDSARLDPVPSRDQQHFPDAAVRALEQGRMIDAIRRLRETTGHGLKDAKEATEHYLAEHPAVRARFKAASTAALKRQLEKGFWLLLLIGGSVLAWRHWSG